MSSWVDALTAFISGNPHWTGVFVFAIAASEAVVLIGYIIPGTAILLAVGGIAGLGHLPLLPILAWGAAGAIVGDGFSYWLGHTYHEALLRRWPFTRYPELIKRGEQFFHRHGGKSVFLGRFVPLLKPIIPTVAGIVGMPPWRFYVANVFSAILWSPAHILPGVLVGASLGLLHGVSARLVVAMLGVLILAVLLVWGARLAVARAAPGLGRVHRHAFEGAQASRIDLLRRLSLPFDPDHPGLPALLVSLAVVLGASIALIGLVEAVVSGDALVAADSAVGNLIGGLRNAWTDPIMVAFTSMGDGAVVIPLLVTTLAWLVAARAWRLAAAIVLALLTTGVAVVAITTLVHRPPPGTMFPGLGIFAFPSGHAALTATLFGLVAWLVAGGAGRRGRVAAYAASSGWVIAVAVSRVYLGAHWPSDTLAGVLVGALACATVAIIYRHAPRRHLRPGWFALVFAGVFFGAGAWHLNATYDQQVARYTPRAAPRILGAHAWQASAWRDLPTHRVDLAGAQEEALSVQWMGSAGALESRLLTAAWQRPPAWTALNVAGFFKPDTPVDELPAPPALHDGRRPLVMLVRGTGSPGERWLVRAWHSGFEASAGERRVPLLVASVVRQRATHPGAMLTRLKASAPDAAPAVLVEGIGGVSVTGDDGRSVLLARARGAFGKVWKNGVIDHPVGAVSPGQRVPGMRASRRGGRT